MNETRREFLKKIFTASVMSASFPHILLGKLEPEIKKKGDCLLNDYYIDLEQYTMLKEIWGSVRIGISPTDGYFPKIIVTRLPKEKYGMDFSCIMELCPHEGKWVKDLNQATKIFVCTGHGSQFNPVGKFVKGPAARDLSTFPVSWDGGRYLKIPIPAYTGPPNNVNEFTDESSNLFYISQNIPNPCSDRTVINYGIEKTSSVKIYICDLNGSGIILVKDGILATGHYSIELDISKLAVGMYFIRIELDDNSKAVKMIIQR
ncbi:MAG: Two component regulator propeller domain protein [Ignavibacteria bacterium]|nr:Two component regulator propeller domain protein [Ignavibacteria bacterium]